MAITKAIPPIEVELTKPPKVYAADAGPALDLLMKILALAGLGGRWKGTPIKQVTWRTEAIFAYRRADPGGGIIVRVKPGDNGSAWDWSLVPPEEIDMMTASMSLANLGELTDTRPGGNRPLPAEAAKPATSAADRDLAASLAASLAEARAAATQWQTRQSRLQTVTSQIDAKMLELDRLEAEQKELQAAQNEDARGRAAAVMIQAMQAFDAQFPAA